MESVVFVVLMLQVSFVSFVCLFTHLSFFILLGKSRELYWRKYHLQRLYDLIKQNEERFYEALANDMKKPRLEAFVGDISPVLEECVYFLDVNRKLGFCRNQISSLPFLFFWTLCRTLIGLSKTKRSNQDQGSVVPPRQISSERILWVWSWSLVNTIPVSYFDA